MKHGAVGHGDRQIKRPATAGVLGEIDAEHAAAIIVGHVIIDPEIVPLAGDRHVVVAVIAHLGGAARQGRHHRAGAGERIALAFLAAKAAAHPAGLDADRVHRLADGLGNLVLDLGRVLGRGMDDHIAIVLREDEGGLAFQIEMLLPAHLEPPLKAVRRGREGGVDIALGPDAGAFLKAAVCGKGLVDGQDRRLFGVGDLGLPRRAAGGVVARRRHEEDLLADIMNGAIREDWFVMRRRGAIVGEGHIFGGQHHDDTGGRADVAQVHRRDAPPRDGRQAKGEVQRVGGSRDIVDIARRARDVQGPGIMREGFGDAHAWTSSTLTALPERSAK